MTITNALSLIISIGTLCFIFYMGVTIIKDNKQTIAKMREDILRLSSTTDDETLLRLHNRRIKDRVARKIISDEVKKRGYY